MVAIHTPLNKGTVYTPVTKTCRVATERGMLPRQFNWERINDISSLYPEATFRRAALDAAKRFVADMAKQGLDLITPEASMLVFGPVRHRDLTQGSAPTWKPAPLADPTFRATGWGFDEDWDEDAEDFLLRAEFLAKKVHLVEYRIKEPESA